MDGEQRGSTPEQGDYGYDLAHDVPPADTHATHAPAKPPVEVVTVSADHDQDYGYDLAHDIPPA